MRRAPGWIAAALSFAAAASAQDWTTLGNDAQRSGWLRSSAKINASTVQGPGFQRLWTRDFEEPVRGASALTPPVLLDFLISHKGFRSLAFVGAPDGSVYAVDTDLDRVEWERHFGVADVYPEPTANCPGGMTAAPTRPTPAALPALTGFAGPRRRNPGFSGVGEPGAGAVTLDPGDAPATSAPPSPEDNPRRQAPQGRVLSGLRVVHALTADGMLRTMLVSNGYDYGAPLPFVPVNANARGLIVIDNMAYAATVNGCGGAANGIWSVDTESGKTASWRTGDASAAGQAGFAVAPDKTLYAATTDGRLLALDGATLQQKGLHLASGAGYATAPVVLDYKEGDYLAVAADDGSVALFAGTDLASGPVSRSAAGSAAFDADALATWKQPLGPVWVVGAKGGAVEAWQVVESGGKPKLEAGWKTALQTSAAPIVANGLVFAASDDGKLHALDAVTGRKLSERDIPGGAAPSGLAAGPNTIYVSTRDGALHAFGFPIEH